jgi:hypothetical protein
MHMGNYITNRAESRHGVFKALLKDGNGDLVKGWEVIDKMLLLQFTEVQTQFALESFKELCCCVFEKIS